MKGILEKKMKVKINEKIKKGNVEKENEGRK